MSALRPTSEAQLAEAVRDAGGPLSIRGGGTRGPLTEGTALSTDALTGLALYDPGALTLVVAAGTPLAEVEAALAAEGQRLPFEPPDVRALLGREGTPTIGGVAAAGASGPRRIAAGACRDSLIGVRFVDGAGTVVRNGGRVMKNVTGYDLVKLMCGAHGTLGVLSEIAIKVLPAPAAAASLSIEGLEDAQAVAAMSAALGSPFEVTGAAHLPAGVGGGPVTRIRIEGFDDSVAYRAARLAEHLSRFGAARPERDPDAVAHDWAHVRDAGPFAGRPGDVWRISVRPSDGPGVAAAAGVPVFYDWGGGLVWALAPAGTDLRARLPDLHGHATLIRADAATRARMGTFHPEAPGLAELSAGLRRRFDPRGILNRGLMTPTREIA